ncbi:MAG: hypothetical protein RL368_906 [Pseudomonadota bacterium]|jgi:ligand-binding SRPBCC domain-containing protein
MSETTTIIEDRLSFEFPAGWHATKFDDWQFYNTKMLSMQYQSKETQTLHVELPSGEKTVLTQSISGMDILAMDTEKTLWLIEVKDYRPHPKAKSKDLHDFSDEQEFIKLIDKVILKLLGALASLLPAKINAQNPEEQAFAEYFLSAKKLCVVLHVEFETGELNPANLYRKLCKRLRKGAIDATPRIISMNDMQDVAWKVSSSEF